MTPEEAKVFENDPLFADSLLIRKYDELAKIENMKINVSLRTVCLEWNYYLRPLNITRKWQKIFGVEVAE